MYYEAVMVGNATYRCLRPWKAGSRRGALGDGVDNAVQAPQALLATRLVRPLSRQSTSRPDYLSALHLGHFRAMRPDLLEGVAVLANQLGHVAIEEGYEDVIGVDVGVAGHGRGNRRRMMKPLGLGVDLQLVLLGVIPEIHIHTFGLQRLDERSARHADFLEVDQQHVAVVIDALLVDFKKV